MICPSRYSDVQIIEVASTWLAQATTRLKRAAAKSLRERNLQDNAVEHSQDEDDGDTENMK